jgi:hypothetical protein
LAYSGSLASPGPQGCMQRSSGRRSRRNRAGQGLTTCGQPHRVRASRGAVHVRGLLVSELHRGAGGHEGGPGDGARSSAPLYRGTRTLNAGASSEEVAQLMRHASVTTTASDVPRVSWRLGYLGASARNSTSALRPHRDRPAAGHQRRTAALPWGVLWQAARRVVLGGIVAAECAAEVRRGLSLDAAARWGEVSPLASLDALTSAGWEPTHTDVDPLVGQAPGRVAPPRAYLFL